MKCPNDNSELKTTFRNGIEINYCPECKGVWLNKNAIDNLMEFPPTQNSEEKTTKDKPNYPEVEDFKNRGATKKDFDFQNPGSFFGHVFDVDKF